MLKDHKLRFMSQNDWKIRDSTTLHRTLRSFKMMTTVVVLPITTTKIVTPTHP